MNVTYTGKTDTLHQKQKEQIEAKLSKIGKLLDVDGKSEKSARVVMNADRGQHSAEVTLNYLDHTLVGAHIDSDAFTALNTAIERLERQMHKVRDKRRDPKKGPREGWDKGAQANSIIEAEPRDPRAVPAANNGKPKVYRVAPADTKPLTEEEAMLVIDDDAYLVYLSSRTERLAVLLRRPDGNFDLVEC